MNGIPVGTWETTRDGEKLTYLESWVEDEQGRPLSLSLPFTPGNQPYRGKVVSDYFDNLLRRNEFSPRRVKLAMSVRSRNAHYLISEIRRRHWVAQGQRATLATEEVEEMIDAITGKTEAVIENVAAQLPKGFPQDVSEKIFDGMRRQSKKLAA
jgi:HipA-like protein